MLEELQRPKTPEPVRRWASRLPNWVHVQVGDTSRFPILNYGEAAALALALETHADAFLADDAEARSMARVVGVKAIGTIGILADAHTASLLDFDTSIKALRSTSFHIQDSVIAAVRSRIKLVTPGDENS